jgi:hypothetical protein
VRKTATIKKKRAVVGLQKWRGWERKGKRLDHEGIMRQCMPSVCSMGVVVEIYAPWAVMVSIDMQGRPNG